MSGPSWLVDSRRIATKIKSASEGCDPKRVKWKSDPTRACPNCNYIIDNSDVSQEWPGLPRGVKFDPSDQEIIWHLLSKVGNGNMKPHPFIDEFIPTVDKEDGICYTHPQNLPGVKQDGSVSHFFHRAIKAYNTGTRKRRKIHGDDQGDLRWHKTGRTKPVSLDGIQRGCKKIMVLYMSLVKGKKPEKTNWVMHQYHLGTGEEENDGEYVVSKVFYQQAKPSERFEQELLPEINEAIVTKVDPVTPKPIIPDPPRTGKHADDADVDPDDADDADVDPDADPVHDRATSLMQPSAQDSEIRDFDDAMLAEWDMFNACGGETGEYHGNHAEDVLDSQIILDSQQLVEGLSLCDEIFQSQTSTGDADGDADADKNGNVRKIKPCLSDYSRMGTEDFKRDLEECQKLDSLDLPNIGKTLKPCESDYAQTMVEDRKQDLEDSQNVGSFDHLNIELDTPPDFRLSQLEFGSQDSFLAWAGNPAV